MSRTLPDAREAFVAAMGRDTPGTDLPRYVKVLDTLISWSLKRATPLEFRAGGGRTDVIGFSVPGSTSAFWSAQVTRGAGPKLEIHTPSGRPLSDEERARAMDTLNAHSRSALVEGDRLRIGFGALKNAAAQRAVLDLMERLLQGDAAAAQQPPKEQS